MEEYPNATHIALYHKVNFVPGLSYAVSIPMSAWVSCLPPDRGLRTCDMTGRTYESEMVELYRWPTSSDRPAGGLYPKPRYSIPVGPVLWILTFAFGPIPLQNKLRRALVKLLYGKMEEYC